MMIIMIMLLNYLHMHLLDANDGYIIYIICAYLTGESELVIWQNGSNVLSAGRKVYLPPEMNKASIESSSDDTFNLRIRNVTVYDAGNYSCQVAGRGTQYSQLVVHGRHERAGC